MSKIHYPLPPENEADSSKSTQLYPRLVLLTVAFEFNIKILYVNFLESSIKRFLTDEKLRWQLRISH